MASKIKADQFETLDGSGNITLNNSVTMASTKTLPAASLTGTLPAISGANLTSLTATNLGSGTIPTARLGSGTASSSTFLRGDGSWQSAGSPSITDGGNANAITIDSSENTAFSGNISVVDNKKVVVGTGSDLEFYHDGTDSKVAVNNGKLLFQAHGTEVGFYKSNSEAMAKFIPDGAVELYHNNVKKLETSSAGVTVTGAIAGASNLGKVLQVVQGRRTGTATYNISQTWTAIGSGSNGLNLTITPTATTSKILIRADITVSPTSGQRGALAFFRGSTQIGQGDANGNRTPASTFYVGYSQDNGQAGYTMEYLDSPSTTSATTYTVKFYHENTTSVLFNQGVGGSSASDHFNGASSITAMEIGV